MEQDTAHDEDKTRTSWHPAFLEAIKLELDQYGDALEYVPEYQLTKEPLRIDMVIVKKRKDLRIEKNIAALFRGNNIIEYKSPSDYISIEDFYKVYAYACLYATMQPGAAAGITDLTITFVGSHYPRKLAEHLEQVRGYVVAKSSPGVYSVKGDLLPLQLIDTRELPVEENLWLAQLDNRLDHAGAKRIIRELDRQNRAERMAAYIDAVCTANFEVMEEVSRMSDTTTVYGKTLENAGYVTRKMILAKMEGKIEGKAEGETAGEEKKALEIARKMKAGKVPTSQISAYTGLAEQQIADLQFSGWKMDFEVMEEVSGMSDTTTVYGKTLENAGYVTRKMILAKTEGEEKKALEIARNALAQGIPPETVTIITGLDIEAIAELINNEAVRVK